MKVLSWNVRGLCDREKRAVVKEVIRILKADIMLIQEFMLILCLILLLKTYVGID